MKKILIILCTINFNLITLTNVISCNNKKTVEKTTVEKTTVEKTTDEKTTDEKTKTINLPSQNDILKYEKIQKRFLSGKPRFLGDLSITPPKKIVVKNPTKVSYEELEKILDKTLNEAAKKINNSFTTNDIDVELLACNNPKIGIMKFFYGKFDLSLPTIARISIRSKLSNGTDDTNSFLFSVLLPAATIN